MRAICVVAVSLLVVFAPALGLAQQRAGGPPVDVTGRWDGTIRTAVSYSPIPVSFKFEQAPEGVTGFCWPGSGQVPITNVKRDGNTLDFDVAGNNVSYHFHLALGADRLEGDVSANDHGHEWTGKATLEREKSKADGKK
jgi:hypothetical protein